MKAFISAILLLIPLSGFPQQSLPEILFMGKLEKLELIPRGRPGCLDPQAREGRLAVSNSCGCGSARFSVEVPVIPAELKKYTLDYSVGEWCNPNISLFCGARFVVFKAPEKPIRWIETVGVGPGKHGFTEDQLDLFMDELGIDSELISFGPEWINLCEETERGFECIQEPVILAADLLDVIHISFPAVNPVELGGGAG